MYMEKDYERAKARLRIDMLDLETEFIEHPSRLQMVVEFAADMMQVRDMAASVVKLEVAQAADRLRIVGEDGKLPSEAKLTSLSVLDAKVIRANEELGEAEHDLRYWQGLAESYRAKGSSLKHISELTVAGWLAPNTNRKQELQEARNAGVTPKQFLSKRSANGA